MNVRTKCLNHIVCFLLAASLPVLLAGCASTPTHESTGEYIDDSTITSKVKMEYARDPLVKATQVNVETFKGVVQLSGFVDNSDAKAKADQLAKGVHGVVRVENNIIVKPVSGAGGKSVSADLDDYSGEITAINTDDKSVTVKKALISHTFQLATGAEITARDRSRASFSDLHVGDHVKVTYMDQNGVKTATRIELMPE